MEGMDQKYQMETVPKQVKVLLEQVLVHSPDKPVREKTKPVKKHDSDKEL